MHRCTSGMTLGGLDPKLFVTAFLMESVLEKCVPLMMFLTLGKRKKSHGAISGE